MGSCTAGGAYGMYIKIEFDDDSSNDSCEQYYLVSRKKLRIYFLR